MEKQAEVTLPIVKKYLKFKRFRPFCAGCFDGPPILQIAVHNDREPSRHVGNLYQLVNDRQALTPSLSSLSLATTFLPSIHLASRVVSTIPVA